MTKEYFLRLCTNHSAGFTSVDTDDLNKFFDSNVCIPKGVNRHPDADVWHEALENALVLQYWDEPDQKWADYNLSNIDFKWRIKPSEPVYEWQWALVLNTIGEIGRTPFMTQQEFDKNVPPEQGIYWTLDIKTKRERK